MKKYWFWLIIFLVFLSLLIVGIQIWFYNPQARIKILKQVVPNKITAGELPEELGDSFDPTKSPSTFMVIEKGTVNNNLQLKHVFPPVVAGQEFESLLACEEGIWARGYAQKKETKVNPDDLALIVTPENGPTMLTGRCSDDECEIIVGKCDIYLSGIPKIRNLD